MVCSQTQRSICAVGLEFFSSRVRADKKRAALIRLYRAVGDALRIIVFNPDLRFEKQLGETATFLREGRWRPWMNMYSSSKEPTALRATYVDWPRFFLLVVKKIVVHTGITC
jgi:hypothetical protein